MSVNAVDKETGELTRVAGGLLYADTPIGTIVPYGGATAPTGYLLCNGAAVSRTTYADLFAAIGTSFGAGDGSTTFNVPDLRGKFAEGTPSGENVGTVKSAGLPNITGNLGYLKALDRGDYFQGYNTATGVFKSSQNQTTIPAATAAKNADTGTNESGLVVFKASDDNAIYGKSSTVQPPAVNVNYIIKALMSAAPQDVVENILEKFNNNFSTTGTEVMTSVNSYTVTNDVVLVKSVLATTEAQYSGSSLNLNGNVIHAIGANSAGAAISNQISFKAYKGDVLSKIVNSPGGSCRVYIYEKA